MKKSSKEKMANDIENRLDDFFDDEQEANIPEKKSISLEKLKSLVLSIDWEITEECLNDLTDEADSLLPEIEDDRYPHTLLRMMKSLGTYIRKRKARAHPDAIKRVMSVFSSIEKLTDGPQLDETVKKQIVAKEISEFKKLKEQVESKPLSGIKPGEASGGYIESTNFEQALSRVENRFNEQVNDLKLQLEALQKKIDQMADR